MVNELPMQGTALRAVLGPQGAHGRDRKTGPMVPERRMKTAVSDLKLEGG